MKKMILLILTVIGLQLCYSQPSPPPYLQIRHNKLCENKDSLVEKFDFVATRFNSTTRFKKVNNDDLNENIQVRNVDNKYVSLYIYSQTFSLPELGDIIRFIIKEKQTDKVMSIYLLSNRLSKVTIINNLIFKEGDYLLDDACKINKRYLIELAQDNHKNYTLEIYDLAKHKISLKKLNRILMKCNH
ncbi:hypothetical protein [Paenimyroides viscosum]|uniref:Uncharacterized protein n=1 Tax=Paenimyroides viscosum TaxID=2488729 RepID=A0A3P1AJ04_9FLAO|nr:hypothetical protein [Paenimyroides viscosum]RRA88956.1 hypothetical protein EG242_14780 [Paenimyroides viscosum]